MMSRQNYAKNFANTHGLTVITHAITCNGPSFTFIPYTDASPTRIDHILTDDYVESLVQQCSVLEDAPLNVSRHLRVYFSLQTSSDISTCSLSEQFIKLSYAWKKPSELNQYKQLVKQNLKRVTHSSFTYDNVDVAYDTIISAMMSAAKISVSTRKVSKFLKPYLSPALGNFSVRPGLLMENLEMENRMTATRTSNAIYAGIYGQPVVIMSRQN